MNEMKRILLIDDDADLRTVLKAEFVRAGYDVSVAPDGVRGFQLVLDDPVDLIILDLNMPHRAGLETLRLIRSVSSTIKVIIFTGIIDDHTLAEVHKLGVSNIVFKPTSMKDLLSSVRLALEAHTA